MTACFAPAKVNLALHITGQRADGYHLLDSLVVFPRIGDTLIASAAPAGAAPSLTLTGRFAAELGETAAQDNLVLRALGAACAAAGRPEPSLALTLDKQLPVASGIGGGSSDAAAALKVALDDLELAPEALQSLALSLGADVPACLEGVLTGRPLRMSGIGETLTPLSPLPDLGMVLVNPGKPVSTPAIFRSLSRRDNPPLPDLPDRFETLETLIDWLKGTRNDMQAAAETLCPEITSVLQALSEAPSTRLARMSGSGATCFALTAPGDEEQLAQDLRAAHPDWWVAAGPLL
ncbi:4-(cytidine 5'-diphospho)-2-C-methyl-D-erythritol kinase [Roseibium aestuarii]|uniref:4-diphosphocytidyl-2-C-methyl-D-erythritol kinase n=1 Tax=Roseibium aestuarii TaxID=2600299 RepID=A0ABW4JX49_9HYPH|nr:4-(cytidine 5'-diphospho)-2-C-methyl-D-erythritol kinase [Roseibium aestuarii]